MNEASPAAHDRIRLRSSAVPDFISLRAPHAAACPPAFTRSGRRVKKVSAGPAGASRNEIEATAATVAVVGAADCGDVRRVARGGKPVVHSGANGASPDGRFSRSLMAGDEEDDAIAMSDRAVQLAVDRTPCAVEGHSMQIDDAIGARHRRCRGACPSFGPRSYQRPAFPQCERAQRRDWASRRSPFRKLAEVPQGRSFRGDRGRIVEATRAHSADSSGLSERTGRRAFGQQDVSDAVPDIPPAIRVASGPLPQKVSNRFGPLYRPADVLSYPQSIRPPVGRARDRPVPRAARTWGRQRPCRVESTGTLSAPMRSGSGQFPEEYIGRIFTHQRQALLRIGANPALIACMLAPPGGRMPRSRRSLPIAV